MCGTGRCGTGSVAGAVIGVAIDARVYLVHQVGVVRAGVGGSVASGMRTGTEVSILKGLGGSAITAVGASAGTEGVACTAVLVAIDAGVSLVGEAGAVRARGRGAMCA